jgi:hypothetical protein
VTDISLFNESFVSVALYVGVIVAMGLALRNITRRLSTRALSLNGYSAFPASCLY